MMRLSKYVCRLFVGGLLSTLGCSLSAAKPVPQSEPNWYSPDGYFTSLAQELRGAMKTGRVISIVQLGDSHIQAGHTTAPLRSALQASYGDAGRGWVGWYSLYGSNSPRDYRVSSSGFGWQRELILKPEGTHPMGVGGYVLSTRPTNSFSVGITCSEHPFRGLRLVRTASSHPLTSFPLSDLRPGRFSTGAYVVDTLSWSTPYTSVTLNSGEGEETDEAVYAGCVLLSGKGGVLVQDIGINGAAYRHYALAEYVEQLSLLEPQLLILSLGTNDSYTARFQVEAFSESLEQMLSLVKDFLPRTKILLTTPPPSFFRRASSHYVTTGRHRHKHRRKVTTITYAFNDHAAEVSEEIMRCAQKHGVAAFDLYSAMGGQVGIDSWIAEGLMATDRVHYNREGYERQGQLITSAVQRALTLR